MIRSKPYKPRKCKECGNIFTPARMGQKCCGPLCALAFAKADRLKMERKELRQRKDRAKPRSELMKEAQQAVNAYVRARDEAAGLPCISCGRHHQGQYHAGHYRSVGSAPHLRFDVERNVHRQCAPCNTHLHGNLVNYRKRLIEKIGIARVEELESDQSARHYSNDDLRQLTKDFRAKTKALYRATV